MIDVLLAAIVAAPWTGRDLPTSTPAAARYRLTVSGAPGTTVRLQATHVADGWIGAFCDMRVCSPGRVTETIPASGRAVVQFELIREADGAPRRSGATITASDGSSVVIPDAPQGAAAPSRQRTER